MGTGLLPRLKRPKRGLNHPPPSSAKGKERVELYLYSPSVFTTGYDQLRCIGSKKNLILNLSYRVITISGIMHVLQFHL